MLVPAIERLKALFGRVPKAVTADRGYGEASVETGPSEPRREERRHSAERKARPRSSVRRVEPEVPHPHQVAHGVRGSHLASEARLRLRAHRARRHRRRDDMVRAGTAGTQQRQDRRSCPEEERQIGRRQTASTQRGARRAPVRQPDDHPRLRLLSDRSSFCRLHPSRPPPSSAVAKAGVEAARDEDRVLTAGRDRLVEERCRS